jgi:hypothetical protein
MPHSRLASGLTYAGQHMTAVSVTVPVDARLEQPVVYPYGHQPGE